MNTRDVLDALHARYAATSQGKPGERWICIEEARAGAGFQGNRGACDLLAINTWQSRGMELIGHEVKVSMSDWRRELDQPEKADRFARYCRRWWVAMPSDLARKVKDEVPPAWGLLSVSSRVTEVVKAPAREPEPVPAWWWVGWLAQIDRQHKRRVPQLVDRAMAEERERMRADLERARSRRDESVRARVEGWDTLADQLREDTGLDVRRLQQWEVRDLAAAVRLVRAGVRLPGLTEQLRRSAAQQAKVADAMADLASREEVAS